MSALFPTICSAVCARYIAAGRAQTNAVAQQIRDILLHRGTPTSERTQMVRGNQGGVPRCLDASSGAKRLTAGLGGVGASPAPSFIVAGSADLGARSEAKRRAEAGDDEPMILIRRI